MTATTRARRTARACSATRRSPRACWCIRFGDRSRRSATCSSAARSRAADVPLGFPAVRARTVFGASFYDSDVWVSGRRQRTGLEARWQPGRMSIQSEYIRLTDERRGQSVEDGDLSPLVAHGWYVSGTYAPHAQAQSLRPHRGGCALRDAELRQQGRAQENARRARARMPCSATVDRVTTLGVNWH